MSKIILDLCGGTGSWSKPYKDGGYDVKLITLPENDVCNYIPPEDVYGILAAPPCPEFSFARTTATTPRDLKGAMKIVSGCLKIIWGCQYKLKSNNAKETSLKFWALENPFGLLRRFLGHPVMTFDPWMWGDMYQKKTCLWGFFNKPEKKILDYETKKFDKLNMRELPQLPLDYVLPEGYNQRKAMRSVTPSGFAKAFYEANK